MNLKKKLLSGGAWALGGKLVSIGCAVLLNMLLTHGLSLADYGAYSVGLNTVIILMTVGNLGMDQTAIRLVAVSTAAGNFLLAGRIIRRCLAIVAIAGLVNVVALALGSQWIFAEQMKMPQILPSIGLVLLWLFASTLQRQIAETFRGFSDIRLATIFGGLRNNGFLFNMFTCVATACFVFTHSLTLGRVYGIMGIGSALIVVLSLHVLYRKVRDSKGANVAIDPSKADTARPGYLLSEGWPLWLAMLVTVLNNQGAVWMAGKFDVPEHVALFALAQQFTILAIAPMVIGNSIVPPVFAELYGRGELKRLERVSQAVAALVSIPSACIFLVLLVGGHAILGTMFGARYYDAYSIVLVLCAGQVVNVATGSWQVVLPMAGRKNETLLLSLFSAVVQLVTGVVGGLYWGVYGVAWAFCLSMALSNIAGMIVVRRRLGIWTFVWLDRKMLTEMASMVKKRLSGKPAGRGPGSKPAEWTAHDSKGVP